MADDKILLIVDGSPIFRTMSWVLEYKGYRVWTADTPEVAIEHMVAHNFELVMAKVSPKQPDGLEVVKRARGLNPDTKVILVSGDHEMAFPLEAYQLEMDDYILMPCSAAELWRRVARVLAATKVGRLEVQEEKRPVDVNERVLTRLAVMFHDLRSSMVSTAATLKLLSRGTFGKMDEGVALKLKEIQSRTKNLIGLTEEFALKALNGDDELQLPPESLDLQQDIIKPVLEELAGEISEYRITIDNRLIYSRAGKILIKGGKPWLKSLFRNLLTNGIKYGGRGCTIVLDLEDQGEFYRLNVYNSGQPIAADSCPHLFARSTHLTKDTARGGDGLGVGLSLVRDIVQEHGGDIWCEPQHNGSNFIFTLPHG